MKCFLLFFVAIFFCCSIWAEDTLKVISLPEIKVIEQKTKSNSALEFSPVITIDNEQIQTIGAKQLSDVLIFSPGINIQNQGGLGGMKTLFIRGMSSARNLIMLDGMPLNSAQNGSFDLNNIDVSLIDNVEIIRGGASSLYGGSAIGGVVNIRTQTEMKEYFKAGISYGSFNEIAYNATLNIPHFRLFYNDPTEKDYISFNLNSLSSKGNYPFTFSQFGEEKKYYRDNADYDNLRFSASYLNNDDITDYTIRYIYSTTDKGIPGAILQGQVNNSNERLKEKDHIFYWNINITFQREVYLKTSFFVKYNTLSYIDSDNYKNNNTFILDEKTANVLLGFEFWNIKNEFLLETSLSMLEGDMLDLSVNDTVNRTILAAGYRLEKDFFVSSNTLRFNLSGRYDIGFSKEETINKPALTGNFGAIFKLKDIPLSLRTNISHNFRFPNFNEMYYRNYGTKDLLPEKSNNINFGAEYNFFTAGICPLSISIDAFYLDIKDMIVAIPISPISWSARNIARAECVGTELAITLFNDIKISKNFAINSVSISYTLQQNLDKSNSNTHNKQLTYIPNEIGNMLIAFKLFNFALGGKLEYSSHRYYQADNSISSLLPSYTIADAFVVWNYIVADLKLNIRFDVKNIFDTQYSIINNYIMPSRQFRLTLGVGY